MIVETVLSSLHELHQIILLYLSKYIFEMHVIMIKFILIAISLYQRISMNCIYVAKQIIFAPESYGNGNETNLKTVLCNNYEIKSKETLITLRYVTLSIRKHPFA